MDHTGKVVLMTGASRGIGRGVALRFADEGADLILSDVDVKNLNKTTADVKAKGRKVLSVVADVSKKADVDKLFSRAVEEFGKIDVSIHMAGVPLVAPLVDVSEKDYDRVLGVNTKGVFMCCQGAARQMLKQGYGKIINCASGAGKQGSPLESVYSASKFAVIGITQSLAKEVAPKGITVNALCPGVIKTDLWEYLDRAKAEIEGLKPGEFIERVTKLIPLGRAGEPSDVAGLVSFLASKDADYITGQSLFIGGGIIMI